MNSNLKFIILNKDDLDSFFIFIQSHWKKNYIFNKDKNFFKWQFYNKATKRYNFIIAKDANKIIGCIGFIPNSIYSSNFKNKDHIWLVNWIVSKDYNSASLKLMHYLLKEINFSFIGTIGCTNKTYKILKAFGFKTGKLTHIVNENKNIKNFKIGDFKNLKNLKKNKLPLNYKIKLVDKKLLSIFFKKIIPINFKDKEYFLNRYVNHPLYKYKLYGVWKSDQPHGFLVVRACKFSKSKSLKIVDYHGHKIDIESLFVSFNKILKKNYFEFIDFYFLLNGNFFINYSNFIIKNKIIVPNFFEPFIKKNIKINYAYFNQKKNYQPFLTRGDCDQDRPS